MNKIKIKERIIIDILLVLTLILLPWWVGAIIAIALLFFIENYFEILLAGLMIDSWYSIPSRETFGIGYGVIAAAVLLILATYFKRKLIIYTT